MILWIPQISFCNPQKWLNIYEHIKLKRFPLYILIYLSDYSVSFKSWLYDQNFDLDLDSKLDTKINLYWFFLCFLQ